MEIVLYSRKWVARVMIFTPWQKGLKEVDQNRTDKEKECPFVKGASAREAAGISWCNKGHDINLDVWRQTCHSPATLYYAQHIGYIRI